MTTYANASQRADERICLVPTMGYFHDGHLSLMRKGRTLGNRLVVSIFVNPTQFGPNEDLAQYPRDTERDSDLAAKADVDVLFIPTPQEMYPDGYQTYVNLDSLPDRLCGLSRPKHFRGVATVVTKLFNIIKPDTAVFGQKDYQQVAIIRRMVGDLNMPVEIVDVPTMREPDGLAMSSRNCFLTDLQRPQALSLYQALRYTRDCVAEGQTDAEALIAAAGKKITGHPDTRIDYIQICDPQTLMPIQEIRKKCVIALAVKVGKTRLIDNMMLVPPGKTSSDN